ncbi:MAG: class SAM-dependent methyltransferase [Bacteroidota bacterium]|nr:class SAM-dependent methyltransferase [Bacteroidota bacterium]
MNEFFRLKKFLKYQWVSKTKYYLHSPFVYQFYLNVLEGEMDEQLKAIRSLRNELGKSNAAIKIEDFGTGNSRQATIAKLETKVAVTEKYGTMLYYLVKYFHPKNILELGTSIGISSAYLALANPSARIFTLEGSQALADIAKTNHLQLGIKNVEIVTGDFAQTLPSQIQLQGQFDLILFDGNHTKSTTLNYFNQCLITAGENSIFIFDDIYWSEEMQEAWLEIKKHPQITLTFDLYQMGICFFKKEKLSKEDFVLRY